MTNYDLINQFQRALHKSDPLARVLVIEVNPRSSLDVDPEDEPVVMDERMLEQLNHFLGPNYSVVTVSGVDGLPAVREQVEHFSDRAESVEDKEMGDHLSHYIGDTFLDCMHTPPSKQWTAICHALRFHGLIIKGGE